MALDNKAIRKYLRQVKRIYHGDKELKNQFMRDLQDALLCYEETNPKCSYADLITKFGTPDEIKDSFSSSGILKKRNVRFWRFAMICSVLITVIVITLTVFYVKRAYDYSKGHYIEYMVEPDKPMISPVPEIPDSTPYKEYIFD